MDCSINESAIVPTTSTRSIVDNSSPVPIRRNLLDCSNDQLIPIENSDHSTEVRKIRP